MALPVYIRKGHRIVATLWLISFITVVINDVFGLVDQNVVTIPLVVLLVGLVLSGVYMLLRPWVQRYRAR